MKHLMIAAALGGFVAAAASGGAWAQAGGAPTGVGDAQQLNRPSTVGATRGGTPDTGPAMAPSSAAPASGTATAAPAKKKHRKH